MSDQPSLFNVSAPVVDEQRRESAALETAATIAERPKLRLVPPPAKLPASEVIVEKVGDVYEVSLLRDHGTTVCAVFYTKPQLEQLIARAKGALEIG